MRSIGARCDLRRQENHPKPKTFGRFWLYGAGFYDLFYNESRQSWRMMQLSGAPEARDGRGAAHH